MSAVHSGTATALGLAAAIVLLTTVAHLVARRTGGWRALRRILGRETAATAAAFAAPIRAQLRYRRHLRLLKVLLSDPAGWAEAERAMLGAARVPGVHPYAALLGEDLIGVLVSCGPDAPPEPPEPWVVDGADPRLWWIDRVDAARVPVGSVPPPLLAAFGTDGRNAVLLDLASGPAGTEIGGERGTARAVLQAVAAQLDARLPAGAVTVAAGVHRRHAGPEAATALRLAQRAAAGGHPSFAVCAEAPASTPPGSGGRLLTAGGARGSARLLTAHRDGLLVHGTGLRFDAVPLARATARNLRALPPYPAFDAGSADGGSPDRGSPDRGGLTEPGPDTGSVGTGSVGLELQLVSGPGAGRTWRLGPGSHEVGSDPHCAVRLRGADVPGRGLWVTVGQDGSAYWHRTGSAVGEVHGCDPAAPAPDAAGLRADAAGLGRDQPGAGSPPPGATAWPLEADVVVGAALLRLTEPVEPVEPDAAVVPSADGLGLDYSRPPRIAPQLDAERVQLPIPPTAPARRPFPLLLTVAPMILGLVLAAVFRSYAYLALVLFSPLMALANRIVGRLGDRKQHEEAGARYRRRRRALEAELRKAAGRERRLRGIAGPDPVTVALTATGPGSRLWERRRRDPDHLVLRLGTVDQPSVKELDDPTRDENHRAVRWNIPDVPIGLDIPDHGVLGVAGAAEPVQALARWLVAQAAVLHSPRDLRVVLLTEQARQAGWAWVRLLPHLRPAMPGGPVVSLGNDPESTADRITELVVQIQARQRTLGSSMGQAMDDPDVLVIVDGARGLRDVPGLVQVLTDGPGVRVFSICLDEQEQLLPQQCSAVVLATGDRLTVRRTGAVDIAEVRADLVDTEWCERIARALAPIRDVSAEHDTGLPQQVRLLELLKLEPPRAADLVERWRRRPASTAFTLGTGYDGPLTLDLVRDGPHTLVAGTAGSGKSELLQAFVASLAAANRPDELTFLLVDHKGGSTFRECAELPHTLGMVTDLDAHQVERALESLGAELRRRERLLAEAGAKDHPEYRSRRLADPSLPPLPRLLLVIDEFATLVSEVTDFVPGLIDIGRRGSSLGLHLVLATQRPSGAVTDDLRATADLRIALRVTDSTESQDIIDSSEAAQISAATPGRALVRLGHRSTVPFQAARVGAGRLDSSPAHGAPTTPFRTDLQALVAAVREAAASLADFIPQPSPWLPVLEEQVLLADLAELLPEPAGDLPPIPYALQDVPQLQQQRVATADLADFGHLYVIGAPRSGRTQVLRTLAGSAARTVSTADLHLYGIDAGGGGLAALESLPHCGAVISRHDLADPADPADLSRLEHLLHRLISELTERQEACSERNVARLGELRALLPMAERPAYILLLIDDWDALAGMLDDHDHDNDYDHDSGRLVDLITRLLREGAAAGIHIVASSERSLLDGPLAAHNDHRLLLRPGNRNDYQLVGLSPRKIPVSVPAGRGWHTLGGAETQVALLAAGAGGQDQAAALTAIGVETARRDSRVPAARRPFPVAAPD